LLFAGIATGVVSRNNLNIVIVGRGKVCKEKERRERMKLNSIVRAL
jgi:hypothetical protein